MPRKPNPGNEKARRATAKYRKKAAALGRPEADFVDAAISAAVYAYSQRAAADKDVDSGPLRWMLSLASEILRSHPDKDFDPTECESKIIQRAGRRPTKDAKRILRIAAKYSLPRRN